MLRFGVRQNPIQVSTQWFKIDMAMRVDELDHGLHCVRGALGIQMSGQYGLDFITCYTRVFFAKLNAYPGRSAALRTGGCDPDYVSGNRYFFRCV